VTVASNRKEKKEKGRWWGRFICTRWGCQRSNITIALSLTSSEVGIDARSAVT
jgi:hypothetical protein